MPVTRSAAAARSKVQKDSTEDKQNEEETAVPEAMSAPLPKTVKDLNEENESHLQTRTAVLLLVIIFACSTLALAFVYYSFPNLDA